MSSTLSPERPALTGADRCDRCGSQAYVRVVLASGGELLFCRHHARAHLDRLRALDSVIEELPEPSAENG